MKSVKIAAIALAAAAFGIQNADAGTKQLSVGGVDSGWAVSWADAFDPFLDINVDGVNLAQSVVAIEKFAHFTQGLNEFGSMDPLVLVFRQTSVNAVKNIVIADETVINDTGYDWNAFRMTIQSANVGNGAASFDVAKTNTSGIFGFVTDPFATQAFSADNKVLDLTNGILPHIPVGADTWYPGAGPQGGSLWINAMPSAQGNASFTLKEQPIPIPLPAAAWTGLAGLVGVGAMNVAKRVRRSRVA